MRRVPDELASIRTLYRRRNEQGFHKSPVVTVNESFFEQWSDSLAWVLGLIWSDGNLYNTRITFTSKDKILLSDVSQLICHSGGPFPKGDKYWYLAFSSKRVSDNLRQLGLVEAKSFTANWPILPDTYYSGFVRGLLDGDGTVTIIRSHHTKLPSSISVAWCGAAPMLGEGLHQWLNENHINARWELSTKTKLWRVYVSERRSLLGLYSLLYPTDSVPRLSRKHERFLAWLNKPQPRLGRPPNHMWQLPFMEVTN